jgi:uncharacterized OB-fold protein
MASQIPLVSYLAIDDGSPHLVANTCVHCGARYLDRRNACARCGANDFTQTTLATTGKVSSFTIVHRAAPGVKVPFVSAIIDLDDGASVQANIVDTEPDPEHVALGMPVKLTTFVAGTDDNGTEAVAFAFAPA